jgi:antitoxin HigA-1
MSNLYPALAVPPGRLLRRELLRRDWDIPRLAVLTGIDAEALRGIWDGTHAIGERIAVALSDAFGTSIGIWTHLQAEYDRRRGNP